MQVLKFQDSEREEWLYARRGKITGSKLKDIYSPRKNAEPKIGYYELIAESLGLPPDEKETALERGQRLEGDAIARFVQDTGIAVDTTKVIWVREDNDRIAISPDGVISETEALEAKCLTSANHIKAYLTQQIPDDYELQVLQYFIVNEKLETLHFIFYDPRFAMFRPPEAKPLDFFEIIVRRADVAAKVEDFLTFERTVVAEVNEVVNKLTF